ncbi:MAG: 23S rRNA (guanosine(2251)-2'-O)-methyltransferase RlmB [Hyphomicrobiaceae bacterium]
MSDNDPRRDAQRRRTQARPVWRDERANDVADTERDRTERRLFGIHAVAFALANPNRVLHEVKLTENAERRLGEALAHRHDIPIDRVSPRILDKLLGPDTVHQGALAIVEPLADTTVEALADRAGSHGPIVVLDQVTDPHNVGAVLRSGAVFGSAGLIMTQRHSPPLGGALAKSASGAVELVPVARVQNLVRALGSLREAGVRVLGLDGEAEHGLEALPFSGRIALVFGAEGKGLRHATRQACDVIVSVSTSGPIRSLNVSNAAAIALHWAGLARR